MTISLRLDQSLSKEQTYALAQKFVKWKRVRDKKYHYLRKYSITLEELESLKKNQDYKCAICLKDLKAGKKTHVDHDHYTGEIRGVLCSNCNLGLGNFKDSVESLKRAVEYLERTST